MRAWRIVRFLFKLSENFTRELVELYRFCFCFVVLVRVKLRLFSEFNPATLRRSQQKQRHSQQKLSEFLARLVLVLPNLAKKCSQLV
jgi:hypothetical protein